MNTDTLSLNLGPQHPSTHGVLRVVLELDGETVIDARPDIGFLHRGIEKLAEHRTYHQIIVLTDRLDYLAALSNNLAYVLTVEKLMDLEVPRRARYVRAALAELQRIASHLFWLGTHAHDLGAMTPLFYALREREALMDIFENLSGSRLTPSFLRVGGLAADIDERFVESVRNFTDTFQGRVDEYETLLTQNPIWRSRTKGSASSTRASASVSASRGPCFAAQACPWISGRRNLTRVMTNFILKSLPERQATSTTGTSSASGRCARAPASPGRPSTACPRGPGRRRARRPSSPQRKT